MTNQPPIEPEFPTGDFVQGRLSAFEQIYTLYYPGVERFAREFIQDKAVAEKIITDTFLKLWLNHTGFGSPKNIEAFLHLGIQRACFDYLKQIEKLTPQQQRKMQESYSRTLPYVQKDGHAMKTIIQSWLQQLPAPISHIARQAFDAGLGDEQIAAQMNSTAAEIKAQKAKAILLLKERWLARTEAELSVFRDLLADAKR